jgi:hypothetical protein
MVECNNLDFPSLLKFPVFLFLSFIFKLAILAVYASAKLSFDLFCGIYNATCTIIY